MDLTVPAPVALIERETAALVVTPHPVTLGGQRIYGHQAAALQPGETLAAFLARHDVVPGQQWVVTIGGVLVHEMHWARVRPKHGHLIECRRVPEKTVLRLAAVIALAYFTFGSGGLGGFSTVGGYTEAGTFLGMSGTAGQLAAATAYIAGTAVINKLLGPKPLRAAENTTNPTYSLQMGGQNQRRLWQPLGLVLGEPYMVPDLGSDPVGFFKDGEQHVFQVFNCGINCADITDLRVGKTALSTYQGVTMWREGFESGNTAMPKLTTNVDSVAGGLLTAPSGAGVAVLRTGSVGAVRLVLDFVGQLFSVNGGSGAYEGRTVDLEVMYRPVGSSTWLPFTDEIVAIDPVRQWIPPRTTGGGNGGEWTTAGHWKVIVPGTPGVPAGVLRLTNASAQPLRRSCERDVPLGQYEVRCTKLTADYTGTSGANQIEWGVLKSYQIDDGNYDGQSRLAVQVQASGQLNGTLDTLNGRGRARPMPCWNGSAWVTATDRASGLCNPGALLLRLARGIRNEAGRLLAGLGFTDDRIDIEGLKAFMVHCAAQGFSFDLYLQDATSVGDLMDAVAAAGMAQIAWPDGKLGVTFYAADDPVEAIINMANIKAGSFVVDYQTLPTADEIELRYLDRDRDNEWTSVRATAPGVTMPRSTAPAEMVGVTGQAHAAALLRFLMAQNLYGRKTVTVEMDLEYMTYRRGQVVALSHDVTQWGYSGRLLACSVVNGRVRLTLDDTAPGGLPAGAVARYIGLRLLGERQMRVFPVLPFAGDARVLELDAAWPAGVALPGSSADNPAHDCLWVYDFKAVPGQLMRVVAIEPSMDGARMMLMPESAEFWDYVSTGAYTPPPATSLLAGPPAVLSAVPSEQLARQGNTFFTDLSLAFETSGTFDKAELWGSTAGFGQLRKLGESRSHMVAWRGGLDEAWFLELRVYSATRAAPVYRIEYTVQGLRQPPPPFDFARVLAQPDGTREYQFGYTTTERPVDWLGASIRHTPGIVPTPDWDAMLPLQESSTHYTASPVELNAPLEGDWTFAFRSIDTTGNLSTPVVVSVTLSKRRSGSTYLEVSNDPAWPGTAAGLVRVGGVLEAESATTWDSDTTDWHVDMAWADAPVASGTYTTPTVDLETTLVGQIDATADALGAVTIEHSTSTDGGATWGAWQAASEAFSGRWVRLRVTVAGTVPEPLATLRSLSWRVSAEVVREYLDDVVPAALTGAQRIGTGDVRAPVAKTYAVIRAATATVQDSTGGAWSVVRIDKNHTTGPRFQFLRNGVLTDPQLVDFDIEGI